MFRNKPPTAPPDGLQLKPDWHTRRPHRLGVWINTNFNYLPNRRGGLNLIFNGYLYTSERRYHSTVNWVCNKNSNLHLKCPARCVTSGEQSIKLSKKLHNHEPIYDEPPTGEALAPQPPQPQPQAPQPQPPPQPLPNPHEWYEPAPAAGAAGGGVAGHLDEPPSGADAEMDVGTFDNWTQRTL